MTESNTEIRNTNSRILDELRIQAKRVEKLSEENCHLEDKNSDLTMEIKEKDEETKNLRCAITRNQDCLKELENENLRLRKENENVGKRNEELEIKLRLEEIEK